MARPIVLVEATAKSAATLHVDKTNIHTSGLPVYTHSDEVRDENTLPGDFPVFKSLIAFERYVQEHTGVSS